MLFIFYKSTDLLHDAVLCDHNIDEATNPGTGMPYGQDWEEHYYAVSMHQVLEQAAQGDTRALIYLITDYPAEFLQALKQI